MFELVEVTHDRILMRVLYELRICGICDGDADAGIVEARVRQTDCMTDFVCQREIAVLTCRKGGFGNRSIQVDVTATR